MATNFFAIFAPWASGGAAGTETVQGSGTAGSPAGGVLSVQGESGMYPITVTPSAYPAGRAASTKIYYQYSSGTVTTTAYTQVLASTPAAINWLSIFDSSGSGMILGVGAMGSEVVQLYVPPGGVSEGYPLYIPSGSRVALKALTASASSGVFIATGLN